MVKFFAARGSKNFIPIYTVMIHSNGFGVWMLPSFAYYLLPVCVMAMLTY